MTGRRGGKAGPIAGFAAALVLAAPGGITAAPEPLLFPGPVQVTPSEPWNMAHGDFNEDGLPDLFVPGYDSSYLSVFLGLGDGTFDERRIDALFPLAAAVGDFDGDGHQDLAASIDDHGDTVSILLGNGDGTFAAPVDSDAGGYVGRIATADFDEDGREDLIVTHQSNLGLAILFGNGDGTFAPPYRPPLSSGIVGVGDLNRDGHTDLVTPGITVQLGTGEGTFDCCLTSVVAGGSDTIEFLIADFNGDGNADVAGTDSYFDTDPDDLWVMYGDGSGRFGGERRYPAGRSPRYLTFSDLDGDGRGDIVAGGTWSSEGDVSVFRGNQSGGFDQPLLVPTIDGAGPTVVRDFDGDGAPDLAVASNGNDTLSILFGRGDGTFRPLPGRRDFGFDGGFSTDMVVEDLDLDGHLDVAAITFAPDVLSVLSGDGAGNLVAPVAYSLDGDRPRSMAAGRLDDDVWPDLAVLDETPQDVSLLLGVGAGSFVPAARLPLDHLPVSMTFEDLDGDGLSDLAMGHASPLNAVEIRLNRTGGAFSDSRFHAVGNYPADLALADLDGDGYGDLVTANRGSDDVSILRGGIGGSFAPELRIPVGLQPFAAAVADLNGDGKRDIVVAGPIGAAVVPGHGDGSFDPPIPVAFASYDLEIVDLDGDGRPDLAGRLDGTAAVALGAGGFSFGPQRLFACGYAGQVLPGDLDGDGRPDLVASSIGSSVAVLINRGPTTLSFASDRITLGWPLDDDAAAFEIYRGSLSELTDADHDGLPDAGYGVCLGDTDTAHNEWIEAAIPAPGSGFFYLVATRDGNGVRRLGTTSAGQPRQPAEVCP